MNTSGTQAAQHVSSRSRTVLIVEADATRRADAQAALARFGYRVLTAEGIQDIPTSPIHVLLVGAVDPCRMRQGIIEGVREHAPLARVLLWLGVDERPPARAMVEMLGIHGWLAAHDDDGALASLVAAAMATHERLEHLHLAERLQAELLANVSHEFRTPLSIIIGYIELIRDGTLGVCSPEVQDSLERVKGNAAYLLELVEEFLDLSRSEPRAAALRVVPLTPFLRELAESFTLLMHEKPVRFVSHIAADLPAVIGDAAKLRVIVQNLLANAAKFTATGQVALAASVDTEGHAVIQVSDTGPGIPPDSQTVIFDLFRQLQPGERTSGIGLGLALARRFARLFGGDITVESTVGIGTTFVVRLPTTASQHAVAQLSA